MSGASYLQTYSLACEPFADTLDGRFFYAGTALMQRLDLLTHMTQFGDAVVLVSGPDGSGKTTLLSRFAAQAAKQWRLCPINADEFEQFPRLMADAVRSAEVQDELEMLSRWASETDNSQLLVILIDKAEALSEHAVDLLCRLLACPVRERLRLILFGTPEAQRALKNSLDSKKLPGSSQLLEVPRLSEEETSSYLMYRLAVAGYSGESPFTATEVRGICKAADGRPGVINRLAHETLAENQARNRGKQASAATGKPKFGAAAWGPLTLGVIALAVYFGWDRLQPTPPPGSSTPTEPVVETPSIPLALPEPAPTPEPEPQPLAPPPLPATAATPGTGQPGLAVPETAAQTEPETATLPITIAVDTPEDTSRKIEAEATEAVTVEAPAIPEPEPLEPQAPPAKLAAPEPQVETSTETVATATDATPADTTQPPAGADEEIRAPIETPTAPEADRQGAHREAWLLAQKGELYSLQLLGSRNRKSVIEYINRYHLDLSQSAYYLGDYRGGEWYVLMYGIYPDRQAALDARADLPAEVRQARPWPRSLASVHKAINDARQ